MLHAFTINHDIHTEPHAAAIIADLLTRLRADAPAALIEEAEDYLAAARREHPHERIALVKTGATP